MSRRLPQQPSKRRPWHRLGPHGLEPYGLGPHRLGPWVVGCGLAVFAAGWSAPTSASAQQVVEEVDSARIRVLERLNSLSRPPGVDSTLFVVDTIGSPPRAAPTPQPQAVDSFMTALFALPGYTVAQYSGGEARFDAETQRMTLVGSPGANAIPSRIQRIIVV